MSAADDDRGGKPTAPMRDAGHGGTALLVIDMVADFTSDDLADLAEDAERVAGTILGLRAGMDAIDAPTIYVNDNFGEWHSDRSQLMERASANKRAALVQLLPRPSDYFVIKPQFSGFYATNLPVLLPKLGISRLIITGVSTDICVLFTAADAHMRDYRLWVPEDAVAAIDPDRSRTALHLMRDSLGAETSATIDLDLARWSSEQDNCE